MKAQAGPTLVGLVMRFNEDDSTLRDLWSEGSNAPKHRYNPHVTDRPAMYRYVDDLNPGTGVRTAERVADLAGYHAEELFIACWPALMRGADLREDELRCVEIVLSKSPCHGPTASSKLRLGTTPDYLPIGCASKLASFITAKDMGIEWRIAFLSLAGSDATDYNPIGGTNVDRLMNARDKLQADTAAYQLRYKAVNVPRALEYARLQGNFSNAMRTKALTLQGFEKGELMEQAKKESRQSARLIATVRQRTTELLNQARTISIGTAQQGITVLESLPNVDVRRWI